MPTGKLWLIIGFVLSRIVTLRPSFSYLLDDDEDHISHITFTKRRNGLVGKVANEEPIQPIEVMCISFV